MPTSTPAQALSIATSLSLALSSLPSEYPADGSLRSEFSSPIYMSCRGLLSEVRQDPIQYAIYTTPCREYDAFVTLEWISRDERGVGAANMVDQRRFDTVAHTPSWSGWSAPIGIRPSREISAKHRRSIGMLATVEMVSSEEAMGAASTLIRWGGAAAILGACPPRSFLSFSRP